MLLAAGYSVALVLMALVLVRGPTRGRWAGLAAATLVVLLTHPRGLAILAPVAATVALAWWRAGAPHGARARRLALGTTAVAALAGALVVVWAGTGGDVRGATVRQFGSYLWQFYLPPLGFMDPVPGAGWGVRDVFVDRFWATFVQFDVVLPGVSAAMAVIVPLGVAALVAVLVVRRAAVRRQGAVAVVFALAFVAYLLAAHIGAWRNLVDTSDDPVMTGRYLLPFMVLFGVGVAVLCAQLPRRFGPPAAAAVLVAAFGLHLAALGALLERFHG
jgi:hypothetical protein